MVYNSLGVLKWNSANKKRYTSLGYIFTRQGDEFLVNIKDLTHRSSAIIEIKCDYCNEIFVRPYNNYVRSFCNAILKKDACNKCVQLKKTETALFLIWHYFLYSIKICNNQNTTKKIKNNNNTRIQSKYIWEE